MDLPFRYVNRGQEVVESSEAGATHMWSWCRDAGTTTRPAPTPDARRRENTGAMTSALLDVLAATPSCPGTRS
jgi:hypothetical protein